MCIHSLNCELDAMFSHDGDCLGGLAVRCLPGEQQTQDWIRLESPSFSGWVIKTGALQAALQSTWHHRVSARTGLPGVSVLSVWLDQTVSLICNSDLSVASPTTIQGDPSQWHVNYLAGMLSKQATNTWWRNQQVLGFTKALCRSPDMTHP